MTEIVIKGAEQLGAVGAAFKAAGGGGQLRRDLLREIRATAKPLTQDARQGALEELPASGGLAALVAGSRFVTRTRLSGGGAGVRIVATNPHDIEAMDAGTVRHPVWGNRRSWAQQSVTPGWFTRSMAKNAPTVRTGIMRAVKATASRIEGAA